MQEKELVRQRITHLIEQGGLVNPTSEPFLCRWWIKWAVGATLVIGLALLTVRMA